MYHCLFFITQTVNPLLYPWGGSCLFQVRLRGAYRGFMVPIYLSCYLTIEVKYLSSRDYLNTHDESEQAIKPLLFKSLQ